MVTCPLRPCHHHHRSGLERVYVQSSTGVDPLQQPPVGLFKIFATPYCDVCNKASMQATLLLHMHLPYPTRAWQMHGQQANIERCVDEVEQRTYVWAQVLGSLEYGGEQLLCKRTIISVSSLASYSSCNSMQVTHACCVNTHTTFHGIEGPKCLQ